MLEFFSFLCSSLTLWNSFFLPQWVLIHKRSTSKFTLLGLLIGKLYFPVSFRHYSATTHCLDCTISLILHPKSLSYCPGISNKWCLPVWHMPRKAFVDCPVTIIYSTATIQKVRWKNCRGTLVFLWDSLFAMSRPQLHPSSPKRTWVQAGLTCTPAQDEWAELGEWWNSRTQ